MQDINRARQEAKERAYPGGTINLSCEVVSPQVDFGRQSGYGRLRRMDHRAIVARRGHAGAWKAAVNNYASHVENRVRSYNAETSPVRETVSSAIDSAGTSRRWQSGDRIRSSAPCGRGSATQGADTGAATEGSGLDVLN